MAEEKREKSDLEKLLSSTARRQDLAREAKVELRGLGRRLKELFLGVPFKRMYSNTQDFLKGETRPRTLNPYFNAEERRVIKERKGNWREIDLTARHMGENFVAVDYRYAKLCEELIDVVQRMFPRLRNLAVVPMGGAINGAFTIREELYSFRKDSYNDRIVASDVDWALVADNMSEVYSLYPDFNTQIDRLNGEIKRLTDKFFTREQQQDPIFNPKTYHLDNAPTNDIGPIIQVFDRVTSLPESMDQPSPPSRPDSTGATKLSLSAEIINSYLLFVHPSFPPEINHINQLTLFNAFIEFIQTRPEEWPRLKKILLEAWRNHIALGPAHFTFNTLGDQRLEERKQKLIATATTERMKPFEKFLNDMENEFLPR